MGFQSCSWRHLRWWYLSHSSHKPMCIWLWGLVSSLMGWFHISTDWLRTEVITHHLQSRSLWCLLGSVPLWCCCWYQWSHCPNLLPWYWIRYLIWRICCLQLRWLTVLYCSSVDRLSSFVLIWSKHLRLRRIMMNLHLEWSLSMRMSKTSSQKLVC